MSALHSELVSIPGLASHDHAPAVLNYHTSDALDEHAVLRVLGGFAFGSLVMGVMLSFGAVAVRELTGHVSDMQREFMVRCATLFGLGFVGASLLLVTLKAREDRSPVALHPRHWIIAMATGAGYAVAVFGPGLLLEGMLPANRFAIAAVWMAVLLYPILCTYWLLSRERTSPVLTPASESAPAQQVLVASHA